MRFLFDITHPAHAHFFRNPARILVEADHEVLITLRTKECAEELVASWGMPATLLGSRKQPRIGALMLELITRDWQLRRYVKEHRPDAMAAIGGVFIAHAGLLTGVPSHVFYDTENATLQNAITYPFATRVIVPQCYQGWTPRKRTIRYPGYHELSYLHPDHFRADRHRAIAAGLDPQVPTFLVRTVAWQANHDIGESHWSWALAATIVRHLSQHGKVILSSERAPPEDLRKHLYRGPPEDLHHLLAYCRAYVGESATIASEAVVLGVPSIYAATTGRGYITDQESRYGLVRHVQDLSDTEILNSIDELLAISEASRLQRRQQLLEDCTDVAQFVCDHLVEATSPR